MNNLWNQIRKETDHYALSADERARVRAALQSHMVAHPMSQASPFVRWFVMRPLAGVLAILFVLVGGGAGLSYASQDSLPNELLYPIKIFKEEVVLATRGSGSEKAAYNIARVETRFKEAATLVKKNELTPEAREKLAQSINKHVSSAQETAESFEKTNPNKALETTSKLHVSLEANGKALALISPQVSGTSDPILSITKDKVQELAVKKTEVTRVVTESGGDLVKEEALQKLSRLRKEVASLTARIDLDANQTTATLLEIATTPIDSAIETTGTESVPVVETRVQTKTELLQGAPVRMQNDLELREKLSIDSDAFEQLSPEIPPGVLEIPQTNVQKSFIQELTVLLDQADQKIDQGKYGEALVLLEQVDEMIEKQKKISTLQRELEVVLPDHIIDFPEEKKTVSMVEEAQAASILEGEINEDDEDSLVDEVSTTIEDKKSEGIETEASLSVKQGGISL